MAKNKFKYYLTVFSIVIFNTPKTSGQQSVLLNQSAFNTYVLNPSAIGLSDAPVVNCHYKKNWLGFAESPEVTQLTIDGPFNRNKSAVGLNILNEKAGISTNTYFSLGIRQKFKLSKAADIAFGISGGFNRQVSDFGKFKAESPEEFAQWPSQQAVTIPDASAGTTIRFNDLQIGVSANHILNRNIVFKEPVYGSELIYKPLTNYVLYIINNFRLSGNWGLSGNLLIRTTQGLPMQPDLSATIDYKDRVYFTCGWRATYALYSGISLKLSERFTVRYFYEYSRQINAVSLGGHELGLRFTLGKEKLNRQPEKSYGDLDGVYEKMDSYDQNIESIRKKMDSLDQNVLQLKSEIERLKNQQLSSDEINKAIDQYFDSNNNKTSNGQKQSEVSISKKENYRIIKSSGEEDQTYDTIRGNYRVVYGVYQQLSYAKEYQKLIKREAGTETILVEIPGHPKKYLYVCNYREHLALMPALKQLREVNKQLGSLKIEITKGKPWILQLSKE